MSKNTALMIVIFCVGAGNAYSDDTHVDVGIGGVGYFSDTEDSQVQLRNETIDIQFLDERVVYDINFEFYNDGPSVNYKIGFPSYKAVNDGYEKYNGVVATSVDGFQTQVNGEKALFEIVRSSKEKNIDAWYVKDVSFSEKTTTRISIQYSSIYGSNGGIPYLERTANYFYGSANTWKGRIETLVLRIKNNSDKFIQHIDVGLRDQIPEIKIAGRNETSVRLTDIKPDKDSSFRFILYDNRNIGLLGDDPKATLKSTRVQLSEVIFYTAEQLRLYRNLFYASNGLRFKSQDLAEFFAKNYKYYGFSPKFDNVDQLLNWPEKNSISVLLDLERRRGQI